MSILDDFTNDTAEQIGYLHISAVVDLYGTQTLMEPLRTITSTALQNYEYAEVTNYVGFFNELFKMFCLICEDERIERVLEHYHVSYSEYDTVEATAYEFPNIALNSTAEDADIYFIRDLYMAIINDIKGFHGSFTWYFNQALNLSNRHAPRPIAFIIDGNDNLCLKFSHLTPTTSTTISSSVTSLYPKDLLSA